MTCYSSIEHSENRILMDVCLRYSRIQIGPSEKIDILTKALLFLFSILYSKTNYLADIKNACSKSQDILLLKGKVLFFLIVAHLLCDHLALLALCLLTNSLGME